MDLICWDLQVSPENVWANLMIEKKLIEFLVNKKCVQFVHVLGEKKKYRSFYFMSGTSGGK